MLDKKGFERKSHNEIIESMNERARELFGDDINLGSRSPLGMFIRVMAWFTSQLWELAEKVYFSGYKDTAEGTSLDNVGQYIGIRKRPAERATGKVVITGSEGITIQEGFLVSAGDIFFETTEKVVIPVSETIEVNIRAVDAGIIGNVLTGTIDEIVNPQIGIDSVINTEPTTGGRQSETDEEFRVRYDKSVATGGSSTIASIEATLLALEGVIDAQVEENTDIITVNDIPAKSIAPFVYAGDDTEIAQAIFDTKAGGIRSFGDVDITITDSRGREHLISFSRPTEIEVYANITLTTASNFPSDGEETIRTNIIKYIGGLDEDTAEYTGLGLGQKVIYTQIIGLCHSVQGVTDVQVELSTDGSTFTQENINIEPREVSTTDFNKVVVV